MPSGRPSAADLGQPVYQGIVEAHPAGSPRDAYIREIEAEIDAMDAEALERDGPDALTSGRLLRQTALIAELDPARMGNAFAAWCRAYDWERPELASWLGVTIDQLAAMALYARMDAAVARLYGADTDRLSTVLAG